MDLQWWISLFAIPIVGGLIGLSFYFRAECILAAERVARDSDAFRVALQRSIDDNRRAVDMNLLATQRELEAHKLRVAESYVSNDNLHQLERRIMDMLEKMDRKIDKFSDHQ